MGYAGTMKGRVRTFLLTEARGEPFTLSAFMKWAGLRGEDDRVRAMAAINQVKRDGELDRFGEDMKLVCLEAGQLWRQTNYVGPAPEPTADAEPEPFNPDNFVDAPRPEEPTDPAPAVEHRCPFEVIGQTEYGTIVLRNAAGKIYKAVPVE